MEAVAGGNLSSRRSHQQNRRSPWEHLRSSAASRRRSNRHKLDSRERFTASRCRRKNRFSEWHEPPPESETATASSSTRVHWCRRGGRHHLETHVPTESLNHVARVPGWCSATMPCSCKVPWAALFANNGYFDSHLQCPITSVEAQVLDTDALERSSLAGVSGGAHGLHIDKVGLAVLSRNRRGHEEYRHGSGHQVV